MEEKLIKEIISKTIEKELKTNLDSARIFAYVSNLEKENQQLHNKIDKAIDYMKDFIFEPLLVNEDRKLIMFNENLRKFEEILKDSDVDDK